MRRWRGGSAPSGRTASKAFHVGQELGIERGIGVEVEHVSSERDAAQVRRLIAGDELAVGDESHDIAPLGLGDVLGRDDQRHAGIAPPVQLLPDRASQDRIDAGRRLVKEADLWVVHEGAGELEASLHAAGQVAGKPTPDVTELDDVERSGHRGAPTERSDSVQRGDEPDVLRGREVRVEPGELRHVGQHLARLSAEFDRVLAQRRARSRSSAPACRPSSARSSSCPSRWDRSDRGSSPARR